MSGTNIPAPPETDETPGDSPELQKILDTVLAALPEARQGGSRYIYLNMIDPRFNGSIDGVVSDKDGETVSDSHLNLNEIPITNDTEQPLTEAEIIEGVRSRFEIALALQAITGQSFGAGEAAMFM